MSATRVAVLAVAGFALFSTSFVSHGQSNAPAPIAVATAAIAPTDLPKGASDVVKLFQMGKKDNVLIFYVNYSGLNYHLTANDVLYLKSVGLSGGVINAMIDIDKEKQKAVVRWDDDRYYASTVSTESKAAVAGAPTREPSATTESEMPNVQSVIYPDYSAFPSYYQSFDNSDQHHVSVAIGIGIGAGFGDGGFHRGYYGRGFNRGRH
jgi:hypothetical protein